MSELIINMYQLTDYALDGFWRNLDDSRVVSKYPLISGGPIPVLCLLGMYLYFVRVAGPRYMSKRDPYDLKWTIRIYNLMMVAINGYLFSRGCLETRFGLDYFGCKRVDSKSLQDNNMIHYGILYFSIKVIELLDTVFFVLRKKYNQASNLHVFHHSFILVCVWVFYKIAPGGSSVLFPYLNCGVHTIMYGYYLLATFKPMQKFLWWKRHLTTAQIIQFVLSMVHFSFQGFSLCEYPAPLAIIGFIFNFVFFVLFCDFYYHAYVKKKPQSAVNGSKVATADASKKLKV